MGLTALGLGALAALFVLRSGYLLLLGVLLFELGQSAVRLRPLANRLLRMKDSATMLALQGSLLAAAARMAQGDLDAQIAVPERHELAPLARALDGMRLDLRAKLALLRDVQDELRRKVEALEARNRDVQSLNEELRWQIEQRSRRLIEALLPRRGATTGTRPLHAGELLGERYRILRLLGAGGMGSVYEVERTTDGRRLAAKVLRATPQDVSATALSRFAREAQIMARLDHPGLIGVADVDVTGTGVLFLVMELHEGRALSQLRPRFGDVTWGRAVLRQIASALAALHGQGIVHRDFCI